VGAGWLARVAWILLLHTYRFRAAEDHFAFGYETGRIARAIVLGRDSAILFTASPARPHGKPLFIPISLLSFLS